MFLFLSKNHFAFFLKMTIILKMFITVMLLFVGMLAVEPLPSDTRGDEVYAANISPDIVNELKDFETLIPAAKIDAIVAEHLLVDGNFRKALKYLRSNEFTHLQQQLLDMPEIIEVLDFLHMTINASMVHSNAARATDEAVRASSLAVNDNGMDNKATNAMTTGTDMATGNPTSSMHASAIEMETRAALAYKIPQLEELENSIDVNGAFLEELPIVDIVQLEAKNIATYDDGIADHHMHHHQHPVGTFTSFVEDIIEQLPHTEYRNMIIQKCKKNAKFANFYAALRSPALKPLVDEAMVSRGGAMLFVFF